MVGESFGAGSGEAVETGLADGGPAALLLVVGGYVADVGMPVLLLGDGAPRHAAGLVFALVVGS